MHSDVCLFLRGMCEIVLIKMLNSGGNTTYIFFGFRVFLDLTNKALCHESFVFFKQQTILYGRTYGQTTFTLHARGVCAWVHGMCMNQDKTYFCHVTIFLGSVLPPYMVLYLCAGVIIQFFRIIMRCHATSYDVAGLILMSQIDRWRNSTPF